MQLLCDIQDVTQSKFIKAEYSWFEVSFPSPRLVALPKLKNPTICS